MSATRICSPRSSSRRTRTSKCAPIPRLRRQPSRPTARPSKARSCSSGYCTIRSPVTGYAGKIMIQQGNLIKANDAGPLVTINQVVPIYVSFSIPEQSLADVRGYQAKGELRVQAALANSDKPPVQGRITFIDNGTDLTTGTIKLKAEFPNTDKALWPGQFVNVSVILHEQRNALVLPSAAVQNGPNGQYVFVVKPDQTAEVRPIKIARAEGNETVVGLRRSRRRAGRHRRSAASRARHARQHRRAPPRHREHLRTVRPAPGDDRAGHGGDPDLRHRRLSAAAGQRAAQCRLPDDSGTGVAARRQPETMASAVATAAREAVLDDRRHRLDDVAVDRRRHDDHAARSRSTGTSTPPRRTCSRPSPRPRSSCRRRCRRRRRCARSTPPTRRS